MSKTAIVIGATGLVGRHLTRLLLDHDGYERVRVFVRRPTGLEHPKIEPHIVDFDRIDEWANHLTGDELFSAMGTTLKRAGSKEAQYRVDFTYQYETARAASRNAVNRYVLVSSAGADPRSRIFYTRMKGELEEAVRTLPFERIVILRPSILLGERDERRLGEKVGAALATAAARIVPPLRKYRPIPAETVARAMINSSFRMRGDRAVEEYDLEEIFELSAAV